MWQINYWFKLNKGNLRATGQSQFTPRNKHLALSIASSAQNAHQHVCHMTHKIPKTSYKSPENTTISHCCSACASPCRENRVPGVCTHSTHTPAGFHRWTRSAGGEVRMRAKGRRNTEARGSQLLQTAHYTERFISRWHLSSCVVLYCAVLCCAVWQSEQRGLDAVPPPTACLISA